MPKSVRAVAAPSETRLPSACTLKRSIFLLLVSVNAKRPSGVSAMSCALVAVVVPASVSEPSAPIVKTCTPCPNAGP